MYELALFAGAGGGILGGKLLGWTTVGAVEIEPYPRDCLLQRQRDGILPPFPIWDDVCTFDGKPWHGLVDVISGGFPCQDISAAGKGTGITGARSGLWTEMFRIICEVRPKFAFMENSPMLTSRGLGTVLGNLAEAGYDAAWCVLGADDMGAPHVRKRIWILAHDAHAHSMQCPELGQQHHRPQEFGGCGADGLESGHSVGLPYSDMSWTGRGQSLQSQTGENRFLSDAGSSQRHGADSLPREPQPQVSRSGHISCTWKTRNPWQTEPNVGRVADGVAARVDRLKAIGNGQVPLVAATAFTILHNTLKHV